MEEEQKTTILNENNKFNLLSGGVIKLLSAQSYILADLLTFIIIEIDLYSNVYNVDR